MAAVIRPPMVLGIGGTSLSAPSRLCTPDNPWPLWLARRLRANAACKGDLIVVNMAKASQSSAYGVAITNAHAGLGFTHYLGEGFEKNDCVPGGVAPNPPVSLAQAAANNTAIWAALRAINPAVRITYQSMNPPSADDTNRTGEVDYKEQMKALAVADGNVTTIDSWATWEAAYPGGLPTELTVDLDKLHPLWDVGGVGFSTLSYPNIEPVLVGWMEDWWP